VALPFRAARDLVGAVSNALDFRPPPPASTGAGVTRNSMEKLIIVTLLVLPRSMSSGGLRSPLTRPRDSGAVPRRCARPAIVGH
jgi:hypothetical protein